MVWCVRQHLAMVGLESRLVLTCVGIVLAAVGCGLVPLVEHLLKERIEAMLVVDTYDKWSDRHTDLDHPYFVYMWNVTNLLAVLEDGAKPHLTEHKFELTYKEDCYDLEWKNDREEYTYSSWWNYYPKDEGERERLQASSIVQINPVYLAAVSEFGGTEANMFAGLSYVVVDNVVQLMDGFVDGVRYYSVPTYLKGVQAALMAGYPSFFPTTAAVAAQWGAFGIVGAALSTLDASLTSFDVGTLGNETYVALWDDASPYSLVTDFGYGVWLGALSGDAEAAALVGAAFPADAMSVLGWLGALIDVGNPYYLATVASALPAWASASVTSWEDLRGLQFGNGTLTAALYGGLDSVLGLQLAEGIVVAPELSAYSKAVGAPVVLSPDEANAFLTVYADAALSLGLLYGLGAAAYGDYSVFADETYAGTGQGGKRGLQ